VAVHLQSRKPSPCPAVRERSELHVLPKLPWLRAALSRGLAVLLFGSRRRHAWLRAQRLPSSTPSPISHTCTQTSPTSPIPLIFTAPMRGRSAFTCPQITRRLSVLFHFVFYKWNTFFYEAVPGIAPIGLCSSSLLPSFVSRGRVSLVLRGTPSSNPVLTGRCNSTTELSSLTFVLHIQYKWLLLTTITPDIKTALVLLTHEINLMLSFGCSYLHVVNGFLGIVFFNLKNHHN